MGKPFLSRVGGIIFETHSRVMYRICLISGGVRSSETQCQIIAKSAIILFGVYNYFKNLQLSEFFIVLSLNRKRNLHTMISDEIIFHFQAIKKDLLVEIFTSEVKANLVKDFLVFDTGQICSFHFLSNFLRLATAFKKRPTPVKVAITTGFSVIPPAIAALIINLPAERLQTKVFLRKPRCNFLYP